MIIAVKVKEKINLQKEKKVVVQRSAELERDEAKARAKPLQGE